MEIIIKEFNKLTGQEVYEIARERVAVFAVEQNVKAEDLDGQIGRASCRERV